MYKAIVCTSFRIDAERVLHAGGGVCGSAGVALQVEPGGRRAQGCAGAPDAGQLPAPGRRHEDGLRAPRIHRLLQPPLSAAHCEMLTAGICSFVKNDYSVQSASEISLMNAL